MTWANIPDEQLEPRRPFTQGLAVRLRNNINTSWGNYFVRGAGTSVWTVPAGVVRAKIILTGGGGGGDGGADGEDSTMLGLTAGGGNGGGAGGATGGIAAGGDLNLNGGHCTGRNRCGGESYWGSGGGNGARAGRCFGSGGGGNASSGSAGATVIKWVEDLTPGDNIPYTVGAGGGNGADGILIIEY